MNWREIDRRVLPDHPQLECHLSSATGARRPGACVTLGLLVHWATFPLIVMGPILVVK